MKLQLTKQEQEAFIYFAKSESGLTIKEFLKRLVSQLSDISTLTGTDIINEVKVRRETIQIINENILDKLKIYSGEVAPPAQNEYK